MENLSGKESKRKFHSVYHHPKSPEHKFSPCKCFTKKSHKVDCVLFTKATIYLVRKMIKWYRYTVTHQFRKNSAFPLQRKELWHALPRTLTLTWCFKLHNCLPQRKYRQHQHQEKHLTECVQTYSNIFKPFKASTSCRIVYKQNDGLWPPPQRIVRRLAAIAGVQKTAPQAIDVWTCNDPKASTTPQNAQTSCSILSTQQDPFELEVLRISEDPSLP